MAPRIQESSEHKSRRRALDKLEKSVSNLSLQQYHPRELKRFSIEILPLPLSPDGFPAVKPLFFQPFEKPLDDPNFKDPDLRSEYPTYALSEEWKQGLEAEPGYGITPMDWARDTAHFFGSYLQHLLSREGKDTPGYENLYVASIGKWGCELYDIRPGFAWQAAGLSQESGAAHRKCFMVCDVNGDDEHIARAELLCITRIMDRFFRAYSFVDFLTVLLLSFLGPRHGRIFQAHFDGGKLVIRKSKLFDFGNKNIAAMKIFIRWWCSTAVGDTTSAKIAS
ncbi:hypothetical protein BJX70DRAFT_400531 [Aspergillus crustosus]